MSAFTSSLQHLLAELERLDLLVRLQVQRARRQHGADEAGLSAFVIPESEVDQLLATPIAASGWAAAPESADGREPLQPRLDRLGDELARRTSESLGRGVHLRLVALSRLFGLDRFDADVVLVCLAPELDARYGRLYAYLHDDVTRQHPTVGLVLDLLCPDLAARVAARHHFTHPAPLVVHRLLDVTPGPGQPAPSLLGQALELDPRVVRYLLDSDELDERLEPFADLVTPSIGMGALAFPAPFRPPLARLADRARTGGEDLVVYCQGGYGVGKQAVAEALCQSLGARLLVVRGSALASRPADEFASVARLASREARLQGAALYWEDFDVLLADGKRSELATVLAVLESHPGPTFLAGSVPWEPKGALHGLAFVRLELPSPGYDERLELWQAAFTGHEVGLASDADLAALAGRFRLSGGQIEDAAATARNTALARVPVEPVAGAAAPPQVTRVTRVTQDDLQAACRLHSNRKLAELAQAVTPRYSWDDLVLPADRLEQLREIHDQVRYRAVVYESWGFGRKLALGKGLNVLFAGPPGTGKTMAADVLANGLGLDLYKIDLSSVVSKYIGETEKNLARIFDEAAASNAILFFDEADALFGKRTQVRDAHDRYANVETSYLLQKMEEYEGVVILATNLRKNMDEAFVRRLHVTVEFPMPGADDRRRIWTQVWPSLTPLDPGLDLELLARDVELAGGSIRNIAVAGAFLAAANGGVVTMDHLRHATAREYQKLGKVQAR